MGCLKRSHWRTNPQRNAHYQASCVHHRPMSPAEGNHLRLSVSKQTRAEKCNDMMTIFRDSGRSPRLWNPNWAPSRESFYRGEQQVDEQQLVGQRCNGIELPLWTTPFSTRLRRGGFAPQSLHMPSIDQLKRRKESLNKEEQWRGMSWIHMSKLHGLHLYRRHHKLILKHVGYRAWRS